MTQTFRRQALIAWVLLLTAGVPGCDSGPARPAVTASPPSAAPSAPAVSPAPRSVPPPPARPAARDGTNYRACRDGACQISVSKPVTIPVPGTGPFKVEQIGVSSVRVSLGFPSGPSLSVLAKKGCTVGFYGNDTSGFAITRCSGEKLEDLPGFFIHQLVTVDRVENRTAVLTLKPA